MPSGGRPGPTRRELAEGERRIVEGQRREAPGMTDRGDEALAQLILGVPIVLLEVLGLQEHPLRPDHLVVPGHSDSMPSRRQRWREDPAALFSCFHRFSGGLVHGR